MKFMEYSAPCGNLLLGVNGQGICLCDWMTGDRIEKSLRRIRRFIPPGHPCRDDETLLEEASRQLDEYFGLRRKVFDLPISPFGTEFQLLVWKTLASVPYGETLSYKGLAQAVSTSQGARAVASAVGANPLSILIPCHRIIGSDGALTGYAGGLEAKSFLLSLEKKMSK